MNSSPLFSRRHLMRALTSVCTISALALCAFSPSVQAQTALTQTDAGSGLRAAMERGSAMAVEKLAVTGGFLNNPSVKIPLPDSLKKVQKAAKLLGMEKQFAELETSMNHAAEAAVPEAKILLVNAVKQMSVKDALALVKGPEDSMTQYFRKATGEQISQKFFPIIAKSTQKVGVKAQYDGLAQSAAKLGMVKSEQASLDKYVTSKAVDGLFFMIAQEEKAIRNDPIGTGSAILKKVFGF